MTRKPRNSYTDHTRADRSRRRQAILDAAAQRMGEQSWSVVETMIRAALEKKTDAGASRGLRELLYDLADRITDGTANRPPADIKAIYDAYPLLDNRGYVRTSEPAPATPVPAPSTPPTT